MWCHKYLLYIMHEFKKPYGVVKISRKYILEWFLQFLAKSIKDRELHFFFWVKNVMTEFQNTFCVHNRTSLKFHAWVYKPVQDVNFILLYHSGTIHWNLTNIIPLVLLTNTKLSSITKMEKETKRPKCIIHTAKVAKFQWLGTNYRSIFHTTCSGFDI